jgi:hypothetical protein
MLLSPAKVLQKGAEFGERQEAGEESELGAQQME